MMKAKKDTDHYNVIKYFPSWLLDNEEDWLNKMAVKGYQLELVTNGCVYSFVPAASASTVYAIEYLSDRENISDDVEDICSTGWKYIGFFGKKRYFCHEEPILHPAAFNDKERTRLSSVLSTLITLLLLNIPGTLYSIVYSFLFIVTGGLDVTGVLSQNGIYLLCGIIGIIAILLYSRWILSVQKRRRKITNESKDEI